jgi:putative sigma-54 modulation protein
LPKKPQHAIFQGTCEKKLAKLDRFFDESAQATILLTHEGEQEIVEVTIPL